MVAISVLILRYVPPDEMPLPPLLQESFDSSFMQFGGSTLESHGKDPKIIVGSSNDSTKPVLDQVDISVEIPLIAKHLHIGNCKSCNIY